MEGDQTSSEDFADMFLNWSFGGFYNGDNEQGLKRANFLNNWMTTEMTTWIPLAMAEP
jgi:hypothetical protein